MITTQDEIRIGDSVSASPVGSGTITGITDAGYPQVNHVAVIWLARSDGVIFDPHNRHVGSQGAQA